MYIYLVHQNLSREWKRAIVMDVSFAHVFFVQIFVHVYNYDRGYNEHLFALSLLSFSWRHTSPAGWVLTAGNWVQNEQSFRISNRFFYLIVFFHRFFLIQQNSCFYCIYLHIRRPFLLSLRFQVLFRGEKKIGLIKAARRGFFLSDFFFFFSPRSETPLRRLNASGRGSTVILLRVMKYIHKRARLVIRFIGDVITLI